MKCWQIFSLCLLLLLVGCRKLEDRPKLNLWPSQTPAATQTPVLIIWTSTPDPSPTPEVIVVEVTVTSVPVSGKLCISATVAVYLRPSPDDQNYPIMPIPNGAELVDLGGRSGKWMFVQFGDKQGWVHGDYVQSCD